jgi:hydrogenase maturation factor
VTAPLGKIAPEVFRTVIAPRLGAARPEVVVGPRAGSDAGVVKLSAGRVMAVTTDPLSIVPAFGFARSARVACHLIASDLWTTGIPPAYVSVDFNLPPQITDAEFSEYWEAMSDEWAKLDVAVVTGHTGRYPGCDYSIVGAATLIGIGDEGRYITPAMASPGDRLIVTKGCAIETTAVVGWLCPKQLEERIGEDGVARARAMVNQISVVRDCLATLRIGVRERGVSAVDAVLAELAGEGILAAQVGEIVPGSGALWLTDEEHGVRKITAPEPDPYWPAYAKAVAAS